MNATLLTGKTF